jgi:hypothetical protein
MSVSLYGSGQTVIQVVSVTLNTVFSTSTTGSWVSVTGLSASITPQSTTSKILVIYNILVGASGGGVIDAQLLRGSTPINIGSGGSTLNVTGAIDADWGGTTSRAASVISGSYIDSPSTTSSTTYSFQVQNNSSTTYVNSRGINQNTVGVSTITLLEISGS